MGNYGTTNPNAPEWGVRRESKEEEDVSGKDPSKRCCSTIHRSKIEGETKCKGDKGLCETKITFNKTVVCGDGCPGDSDELRNTYHKCGYAPCKVDATETETPDSIKFMYEQNYVECYASRDYFGSFGNPTPSPYEGGGSKFGDKEEEEEEGRKCKTGYCPGIPKKMEFRHNCCPTLADLGNEAAMREWLAKCEKGRGIDFGDILLGAIKYITKVPIITNLNNVFWLLTPSGAPVPRIPQLVDVIHKIYPDECTEENIQHIRNKLIILDIFKKHRKDPKFTLHHACMLSLLEESPDTPDSRGFVEPRLQNFPNKEILGEGCKCLSKKQSQKSALPCCIEYKCSQNQCVPVGRQVPLRNKSSRRSIYPPPKYGGGTFGCGNKSVGPLTTLSQQDELWFRGLAKKKCTGRIR